MVCLLSFTDMSQPLLSEQEKLQLLSGMELPLENLPEPEWLDNAEDGDETMLELTSAETILRGSVAAYSAAARGRIAGRAPALEPPPPWPCG